ncbi:MAG: hypothetical protein RR311_00230 [Comamonas sp.]
MLIGRTQFLLDYAPGGTAGSLVLGVSGGVGTSVAGRLCQLAAQRLRVLWGAIRFCAMRLPYGA